MQGASKQLEFEGRQINLTLSDRAEKELRKRETSLSVSMELLFSCLLRKRVLFDLEQPSEGNTMLGQVGQLNLYFTTRMTKACHVSDLDGPPDSVPFPMQDSGRFLPGWLEIDYHPRDGWKGSFGYAGGH